jgi:hypothetical protein
MADLEQRVTDLERKLAQLRAGLLLTFQASVAMSHSALAASSGNHEQAVALMNEVEDLRDRVSQIVNDQLSDETDG